MLILALAAPFLLVAICLFAAFFISKRQRKQEIKAYWESEEWRTNIWSDRPEPEIAYDLAARQLKNIDFKPYTPSSVAPQKIVPADKPQTE